MGFIAALRQAEEHGKTAAKLALGKTRHELLEAETALRRRMRVHPQPAVPGEKTESVGTKELRPIVSLHGRDVEEDEIERTSA
jgi:hypothetical protein